MAFSKALIVDDSKLARVTLKKKLESFGLEVLAADGATEAYDIIASKKPDIVFMDHLMPEIDGFEATVHLRNIGCLTPIIMCTGKEHEGYLAEALAIGANYILGKPPGDEALAEVLAMEFGAVAASGELAVEAAEIVSDDVMTVDDFDLSEFDDVLAELDDENIPLLEVNEVNAVEALESFVIDEVSAIDEDDDEELDDWMQSLLDDDVDTATDEDLVDVINRVAEDEPIDDESSYFIDEPSDEQELSIASLVDEPSIEQQDASLKTDWLDEQDDGHSTVMVEAAALEGLVNARVMESQALLLAELDARVTPLQLQLANQSSSEGLLNQGVDRQEIEMLVQAGIDASRSALMHELGQEIRRLQSQLDSTPIAVAAETDERELLIRLEEVLHPRLIELKSSLLADVQSKMQADKESGFDELLDLRLNALLAERMASFDARIKQLEENQQNLVPMNDGIPVIDEAQAKDRYRLSEKVSRHLEQLIEENAGFAKRIAQIRQMSLIAGAAGAAGLLIATLQFLLG